MGSIRLALILFIGFAFSQFAVGDPPYLGVSGNLSFTYQIGGAQPSPGSLTVTNISHGDMAWTASITNAPWASISPSSGSLPDTFTRGISSPPSTVTVNPAGLAVGSYGGLITVTATSTYGVPNSPQSIPITLLVGSGGAILMVNPQTLSFSATQGVQDGGSANISITNAGGGSLSWSASTNSSASWLSYTSTSTSISVKVGGKQLAPGTYSAEVLITAPAAVPSSYSISVTLTVQAATPATFVVDTSPLTFKGVAGAPSPPAQTVSVANSGQVALNWQASASTSNGGGWLKVSPASGVNGGQVSISPDTSSLATGIYVGKVTMTAIGATSSPVIPVTLTVIRPASFQTTTTNLTFNSTIGTSNPPSQVISFQNGGDAPLTWKAAATTSDGNAWLKVTPAAGTGNSQVIVSVDNTGMAVGTYTGKIALACDAGCVGITIPMTSNVLGLPSTISAPGAVSAARLTWGAVSAGGIVTVFGTRLGPDPGVPFQPDSQGNLPISLGGTTVLADGVPAPLFYVSASQINFQLPYEVAGKASTHLVIQPSAAQASALDVPLLPASLAFFTWDGKQAIVVNQDYSLNTAATPANAGDIVTLYGTGQGPLNPVVATGAPGPLTAPFPAPTFPITMTVNGESANVLFAGTAPELVGVLQINVQVPADTPSGPATLVFQQGGVPSNQTVAVYVQAKTGSSNALPGK